MTICKNCSGEGLVGVGEQPWLKQGPISTCTVCSGTGKVEQVEMSETEATPGPTPVSEPEATEEPKKNDGLEESSQEDEVPTENVPVSE